MMKKVFSVFYGLLCICILFFSGCSSDKGKSDQINEENLPYTLSDKGLPLEKKRFIPLTRIVEYIVLGTSYDGTANNQFIVNPTRAYSMDDSEGTWGPADAIVEKLDNQDLDPSNRKVANAGNLDDDFYDETVLVTWYSGQTTGKITIIDAGDSGRQNIEKDIDLTVKSGTAGVDYDLALADVDADDYDEIIITGTILDKTQTCPGQLWIFDDSRNNNALIRKIEIPGNNNKGLMKAKVAAGSMKGDQSMQIVVGWYDSETRNAISDYAGIVGVFYSIYNASNGSPIMRNKKTGDISKSRIVYHTNDNLFNICLADLDGDKKKELVIAAMNTSGDSGGPSFGSLVVYIAGVVLDDLDKNADILASVHSKTNSNTIDGSYQPVYFDDAQGQSLNNYPESFVLPVNYYNDGCDRLLLGSKIMKYSASFEGQLRDEQKSDLSWEHYFLGGISDIKAGDINNDLRDDILVLYKTGRIRAFGMRDTVSTDASGNKTYKPDPFNFGYSGSGSTAVENAILVPANVDDDSTVVEYKGDEPLQESRAGGEGATLGHYVIYKEPKIIAVLAAPPTIQGQTPGSFTTFGTGTSESFKAGINTKYRTGFSLGTEVSVSAGLFANVEVFRLELEIQSQLELSFGISYAISKNYEIEYQAAEGEDRVVFAARPYDRFVYNIISYPDGSMKNKEFYIDIPQEPIVLSQSREYYNSHHKNGLQITGDILGNTPYELSTYPHGTDGKNALLAKSTVSIGTDQNNQIVYADTELKLFGETPQIYQVDEGKGGKTVTCGVSNELGWGGEISFSIDGRAKAIISGVSVGGNVGYTISGSVENTISNSTSFSSCIYGLPGSLYDDYLYSYGVFAYKQVLKDEDGKKMQDFFVVNYWVQ